MHRQKVKSAFLLQGPVGPTGPTGVLGPKGIQVRMWIGSEAEILMYMYVDLIFCPLSPIVLCTSHI